MYGVRRCPGVLRRLLPVLSLQDKNASCPIGISISILAVAVTLKVRPVHRCIQLPAGNNTRIVQPQWPYQQHASAGSLCHQDLRIWRQGDEDLRAAGELRHQLRRAVDLEIIVRTIAFVAAQQTGEGFSSMSSNSSYWAITSPCSAWSRMPASLLGVRPSEEWLPASWCRLVMWAVCGSRRGGSRRGGSGERSRAPGRMLVLMFSITSI